MKPGFYLFLFVYFALVLLVGFWFSRNKRMKSLEDFFLASRNLSAPLVYVSLCASWIGAASVLVSMDEAHERGLSSFWVIGLPAVMTVLILAVFMARRIRSLHFVTLPDLFEQHYGRCVRHLASLLIVWYMIVLAASQMVAVGSFLKMFLGWPYLSSLALGTGIVLIYSVFGGFFSVVVTDFLQFILLTAGIVALIFFLAGTSSFPEVRVAALELGKSHYFHFFAGWETNLWMAVSFILAWTISPIAWQRIQAARTVDTARKGLFASAATFFLFYWLVVLGGMLSLPLVFSPGVSGPVLSRILSSGVGFFLGGLLFVAVVSAVMSTMDTAINTGALSLTRDVCQQLVPSIGTRGMVAAGRLATFVIAGFSFLVATRFQSILKTLGLASEIMAEGLFIPGMAMLFLKGRWPAAGLLSLVLGGGFSAANFLSEAGVFDLGLPEWPFSLPYGLGFSLAGFLIGLAYEKRRRF